MRYLTHLTTIFYLLIALAGLLSGCSAGRNAFSSGQKLEAEGKYEEAMYSYADAFRKNPESTEYRTRFLSARESAANQYYKNGLALYNSGDYVGAQAKFQQAYGLNPQAMFKQQVELTARLKDAQLAYEEGVDFEKGNKFKEASRAFARAVELHPDNKDYQAALARVSAMRKSKLAGFELNLKSAKPITLKFKDAKLKEVFGILTKLSGINFVFDEGIKDQNITIYLENATFQQALELLVSMNKLGRKVLNESTVIIYPKSPDKVKQYEDMEVRTFHLNYLEAKKAINLIRGMIQVRKIQVSDETNSILVRDTKDIVDVVERLLDANDVPDAEVVLDVEVLELTDTNAQNVGLLLSDYSVHAQIFKNGLPVAQSLSTPPTNTGATSANLVQLFSSNPYSGFMTLPTATYNLQKNLTKGEVLSNPKIRIKNREKSKFNVGTRVPITTTTLNGTISQVNVQYVDVGVKVNAEPNIQLNNDVVIKLNLEVSSVLSTQQVGPAESATQVVTIGTRNLETVLSLKDGETSVIGGLIERTNSNAKTKIFLLGDLPLIGPLISNNNDSKQKTELVLAITPRLVRGVTVPQMDVSAFMSGKEDDPTLVRPLAAFDEEPVFEGDKKQSAAETGNGTEKNVNAIKGTPAPRRSPRPASPLPPPAPGSAGAPAAQAAPVAPVSQVAPPPEVVPAVSEPSPSSPSATAPAKGTPAPATSGTVEDGVSEAMTIIMPSSIKVGQQLTAELHVSLADNLVQAPFILFYDPQKFDYVSVSEGPFLKSDGKETTFSVSADTSFGAVTVNLARKPGSGGISGGGALAYAVFRAKQPGSANFSLGSVKFVSADGGPYEMPHFGNVINVEP